MKLFYTPVLIWSIYFVDVDSLGLSFKWHELALYVLLQNTTAAVWNIIVLFLPFHLSYMHVAYHRWPRWLLVTSHPLKNWVPTSALCLALTPTLCYCFCRPRLDSVVPVVTNENLLSGCQWFEWFYSMYRVPGCENEDSQESYAFGCCPMCFLILVWPWPFVFLPFS